MNRWMIERRKKKEMKWKNREWMMKKVQQGRGVCAHGEARKREKATRVSGLIIDVIRGRVRV